VVAAVFALGLRAGGWDDTGGTAGPTETDRATCCFRGGGDDDDEPVSSVREARPSSTEFTLVANCREEIDSAASECFGDT